MAYQSTLETPREDEATDEESAEGEDNECRLILVGKSGGGKSATGNTILGRKEFESITGAKTTTLRCQKGQGMKISVVDTSAMFDSQDYNEIVRREIMACMELSRPGPHALILVSQVGRFTAEDATAAKCVWDIFGATSARHTIVLFTCVEDLDRTTLKEFIRKSKNRNLKEVIRQCENKVCGFNNRAKGAERKRQVLALMEMVQRTVSANEGRYYTNRLYRMHNVQDEDIKAFLAENKTGRERAAQRRSSSFEIATAALLSCLLVIFIITIILMVRFL